MYLDGLDSSLVDSLLQVEELQEVGEAQTNKTMNRSKSLIYSQPQESERSAIKTLASQHLRDLETMHEQHSQDIQAIQDQHKDVRNNHKKEMKEAEKKSARMIAMLDKVIECQDNQMRHHEEERKLREKEVKELREVEAKKMEKYQEMKEVEVEEMKAEHDAKVKLREKEAKEMRDKVFKLEEDNRALQCQVERLRMDANQT